MDYDKDIPDFALQPARDTDSEDQFDPSPYDRLLNFHTEQVQKEPFDLSDETISEQVGVVAPLEKWTVEAETAGLEIAETTGSELAERVGWAGSGINQFVEALDGDPLNMANEDITETAKTSESDIIETAGGIDITEADVLTNVDISEAIGVAEAVENTETAQITEAVEITETTQNIETTLSTAESVGEPISAQEAEVKPITVAETVKVTAPTTSMPADGELELVVPVPGTIITNELKMTDIREKPEIRIYVEEDILVPDTKEDLASILSMTGKVNLAESEIRISQNQQDSIKILGEIDLHTLYIPENYEGEHHIINIQSRLPFKAEKNTISAQNSRIVIKATIEAIDYTVINERKFRAKLTVKLSMREYANVEMQVFQGIKDEKLQLLKEKIQMTHVSERKSDTIEINETMSLKDTQPQPTRILKYDVDIVENHKQITADKAIVNATIYCNVLYLSNFIETGQLEENPEAAVKTAPQLFQGKIEFTQFIPLSNPAEGSKISFSYNNLAVHIKEASEDSSAENGFLLEGSVETSIEIYKNLEREIVTDIYHRTKDIVCDKVELEAMSLGGSGVTEAAVREIINVPEKNGDVKRVIYIFGNVKDSKSFLEQNKNIVEGVVGITLLCLPEDEKKTAFAISKDINFRGAMEIPMGRGDTKANSDISIKELWFDRINAKQIEVNANLFISSSVYGQEQYKIIQNVCFATPKEEPGVKPGMVVYITKNGDTLWDIAKKYRTTTDMITEINGLTSEQTLQGGMKLLIVK